MTRSRAFLIQLAASFAALTAVYAIVRWAWYPEPLFALQQVQVELPDDPEAYAAALGESRSRPRGTSSQSPLPS